jgi:hypothetical protein
MRKFAASVILVLALLLVAGGIGAAVIWQRIHDPYKGFADAERFIDVTPGTGTSSATSSPSAQLSGGQDGRGRFKPESIVSIVPRAPSTSSDGWLVATSTRGR